MPFEMPKPGPRHEKLKAMVGEFVGEETMMPGPWSPEKQQRTGKIKARMLESFFVISDYEQSAEGQVTFRGHGVYGWDPQSECYRMYWFDSMGGAGGIADGYLEGNVLTFRNTSPMGHHRYTYTFEKSGMKFEMAMSQDGERWQTLMEGRYRQTAE
jgi:hypothetical protein